MVRWESTYFTVKSYLRYRHHNDRRRRLRAIGMTRQAASVAMAVLAITGSLAAQQSGRATTPPPAPQALERAAQVLADARKAMGGDKLASLQSLVATGRTQRVRGNNLVPIEFEMAIERPDKYVRKDEVPAEESGPTTTGFAGDELIQTGAQAARGGGAGRPAGPGPAGTGPAGGRADAAPTPEQLAAQNRARVVTARQDFTRLSLGILLDSLPVYPLTFAFAAQAAAPQGTADVLDVRGAGNFAARLFIDSTTRLPIMLSWQAPAPGQPTPVETRLYYADYREVNGAKLPFRLRRAVGADTTEETAFDRFRLNTKIDPKRFTVPK